MKDIRKFNYDGKIVTIELIDGQKMVNATEMAKPFGKRPADFLRNKGTQEFLFALRHSQETKGNSKEVLRIVRHGDTALRGTWVNEPLALKFAAWLAPDFEVWIYERIHELLTKGQTELSGQQDDYHYHLRQLEDRLAATEMEKEQINERLRKLEAKQVSAGEDYFTVAGFCHLHQVDCPLESAKKWGIAAKRESNQRGMAVGTVHDARYGKINSYHKDILRHTILGEG
ncbi:KilA-N domain-containing protein [Neolewinella persica]|uniref:KilA-N domain-containing protein n=1 Tax=Neolewinella persica TaxID=70998 RepID=UPI000365E21B|nr:KilA-N domain-containing protein [Neolewinella persica]